MKIFLKIILTVILLPVAGFFALVSQDMLAAHSLFRNTATGDVKIYKEFLENSRIVDKYIEEHGSLPDDEYIGDHFLFSQEWLGKQRKFRHPFPRKIQDRKVTDPNAYILKVWRTDDYEYFASPSQETTVAKTEAEYFLLGSSRKDGVLFGIISLFTILLLVFGWRKISRVKFENT